MRLGDGCATWEATVQSDSDIHAHGKEEEAAPSSAMCCCRAAEGLEQTLQGSHWEQMPVAEQPSSSSRFQSCAPHVLPKYLRIREAFSLINLSVV